MERGWTQKALGVQKEALYEGPCLVLWPKIPSDAPEEEW